MIEKEKFIQDLYEKTIDSFLSNVSSDKEELALAYKSYLYKVYMNFDISTNYDKLLEIFSNSQMQKWQTVSEEQKKSEFLKDAALEKIGSLSDKGYEFAKNKLSNNQIIEEELATNAIKEMEDSLKDVREFNKTLAQMLCSEGTLDYLYAANLVESTSLRIGNIR